MVGFFDSTMLINKVKRSCEATNCAGSQTYVRGVARLALGLTHTLYKSVPVHSPRGKEHATRLAYEVELLGGRCSGTDKYLRSLMTIDDVKKLIPEKKVLSPNSTFEEAAEMKGFNDCVIEMYTRLIFMVEHKKIVD